MEPAAGVGSKPTQKAASSGSMRILTSVLIVLLLVAGGQYLLRRSRASLHDPLRGDSEAAMSALAAQMDKMPTGKREPTLLGYVQDASPGLREAAFSALDQDPAVGVSDAMERSFQDNTSTIRVHALENLYKRDMKRGLHLLLAGLRDHDTWVRQAAIEQLANLSGAKYQDLRPRIVPALIRSLDDEEPSIPFLAMNLLRKLTGQPWHVKGASSDVDRAAAIANWKAWWNSHRAGWPVPEASLDVAAIQPERADPAPDFDFRDVDGRHVRLADQKGRLTLLNFWGTWCPPCRHEAPALIQLDKEYRARNLDVVGIALAEQGGPTSLKGFCAEAGIGYRQALAADDVLLAYGDIHEVPVSVLIDRQGRVRYRWEGDRDYPTFKAAVERLLQER